MNKLRLWLSAVLAIQACIILLVFAFSRNSDPDFQKLNLFNIEQSKISKLLIDSKENNVLLHKMAETWMLPNFHNLPADADKVTSALSQLSALKSAWPVTTKSNAHKRFEVADDSFQKKLQFFNGSSEQGVLFIGSSPSFRKSHVRPKGDNNVYALEISSYEFPDTSESWLDTSLLAVDAVNQLTMAMNRLEKRGDHWLLLDSKALDSNVSKVDDAKLTSLIQTFEGLTVNGVAEKEPDFASKDVISIDIVSSSHWLYQFLKDGENYYVKRNDYNVAFTISQDVFETIDKFDFSSLLDSAVMPEAAKEVKGDH